MRDLAATVVIPSFARPERLRTCLEALGRLDPPVDRLGDASPEGAPGAFEVVVVDDGSPVPLAPVVAPFPFARCLRQDNAGPAAARNAGARAAQGRFLAFTDDDCRPEPGWLRALMARHGGVPGRLVGGRVVNLLDANPYASASQSLCDFLYEWWGAEDEGGAMPFFTSNNMGCLRDEFLALGGFDETFPLAAAEDRELGMRWGAAPERALLYAPDAVVGHTHALSFRSFLRQHANYGRGARHLHRVLDAQGDPRPRREALRFYLALVTHPLRRARRFRLSQAGLLLLSQAAMVRGYLDAGTEGRGPGGAPGDGRGRSRAST